jgi:hypothetical protein
VARRIALELFLACDYPIDFLRWDNSLLDNSMRHHSGHVLVEEVENPVVHPLVADAQLIDAVTQVISFGSSQLMSERLQPFQLDATFVLDLG